ncbi:Os04g0281900 [Oryza sativa Japonica Group]|uniref:Os04g0281900 protein n=1 Tax=Oryza sativa subsp. japonica TaxID=39947 RepID=A0A0P0W833_ORYSJ|nr:hypothetical protein EE612_022790 [Oryza sativa]BAS88374.1 Os04g0281900 [Oryza sativa Japonica Group]
MSKMAEEKVLAAPATVDGGMQSSGDLQASSAAAARVRPVETLLRAAPLGLCVAAMAIMLRNSVTNERRRRRPPRRPPPPRHPQLLSLSCCVLGYYY